MLSLDILLIGLVVAALAVWAALSAYLLAAERSHASARAQVSALVVALDREEVRGLADRAVIIRPLLANTPRELVMRAAADTRTPPDVVDVLAAHLVERWGLAALECDAARHRTMNGKRRRVMALRILFHLDHARATELLDRALDEPDADVASVALALLGESTDPAAAEILVDALRLRRHPRSRIAVHVDRSPQHLAAQLRPLLVDADPGVRRWAATLLGRYGDVDGLERELATAADDPDPRVRKAAVQSLGQVGDALAGVVALRLLHDPVAFVRAAAVRAVSRLDRQDLAADIAALLGDRDWWVRFAAKECLESMGPDVWPVLVRLLDDHDRFVRSGAAEVFQNVGVLDSFIVLEAASDVPAAGKIDLLRRIAAAGGLRLTDSLLDRAGPHLRPRVRRLLSTVGLEHVGAA